MKQVTLFGQIADKSSVPQPLPIIPNDKAEVFEPKISKVGKEYHTVDYCVNGITKATYLWDMRIWNKDHDRKEVLSWIHGDCYPNNAGHVQYCIRVLILDHGWTVDQVANLVLQNNHVDFKNCKVQCFNNIKACPHWNEGLNFGDMPCEDCQ